MTLTDLEPQKGLNDAENLTKLLTHLAPAVFREFMASEFDIAMPEPDEKRTQKEQRKPMALVLSALDVAARQKIEEVAEKLVLLSDGPGQDVVDGFCGGIFENTDKASFDALRNQYERALWLYQNEPDLFKEALDARQADVLRQSVTCYSGFVVPKHLAVATSASARHKFHEGIAEQFGCGRDAVAVQIFKRLRPDTRTGEEVALYQISIHHNRPPEIVDCVQASELVPQEVIRAVASHITYEPANGHLEVLSRDPESRGMLARLAADMLLQSPISGEKIPLKQYDYQSLAAPRHFDIAGEDITSVKVTELGYTQASRTLLLKILASDGDDIYTAARSIVGPTFDFRHHHLTYAKLSIRLKKSGKGRARTLSIILREDNKCNIKTKREKDRALCDRLLVKWKLVKEIGDAGANSLDAFAA